MIRIRNIQAATAGVPSPKKIGAFSEGKGKGFKVYIDRLLPTLEIVKTVFAKAVPKQTIFIAMVEPRAVEPTKAEKGGSRELLNLRFRNRRTIKTLVVLWWFKR